LRASGAIKPEDKTTIIKFWLLNKETPPAGAYEEVEFTVGVALHRFPGGGSWSFFVCPCGRRCRIIRLYEGKLACKRCLQARGLRSRIHMIAHHERYFYTAPKRRKMIYSREPLRLHPRWPGQTMERRAKMKWALERSKMVMEAAELKRLRKKYPGEFP
jgi:hypothetical protein